MLLRTPGQGEGGQSHQLATSFQSALMCPRMPSLHLLGAAGGFPLNHTSCIIRTQVLPSDTLFLSKMTLIVGC